METKKLLESYLEIAKDLKDKGELDPQDDSFMEELYNKLADSICFLIRDYNREQIFELIQKTFEDELL